MSQVTLDPPYRPTTHDEIAVAAALADVVRLSFSSQVRSVGAMARLVSELEQELRAAGRERTDLRVELEVEVVLADDEEVARVARDRLAVLDAVTGVGWPVTSTRIVASPRDAGEQARALADTVGADEAVLVPLGGAGRTP